MIKHILKLLWNKRRSNALLVIEILLSFIVLFFALAYIFFNTEKAFSPIGFDTENRWMIALDDLSNLDSLNRVEIMTNLKSELLNTEEIEEVTFTTYAYPFSNSNARNGTDLNGFQMTALIVEADSEFNKTLNPNIIEGRWFNEEDYNSSTPPIIVNKLFMETYYPNHSMIDSTILFDDPVKIIGVVEDYRYQGEFSEKKNIVFRLKHFHENTSCVVLKMANNTNAAFEEKLSKIVNSTTNTTGSIIQNVPKLKEQNSQQSWLMIMAILFTCTFLCLNISLGLFGVLWYNINKRKSEIGLRQALGASGFDISKQFVLEVIVLAGIALLFGIFFTIQIPLLNVIDIKSDLFYKAIIYATLIILTLVFLCSIIPSIQAANVTPANSLHED